MWVCVGEGGWEWGGDLSVVLQCCCRRSLSGRRGRRVDRRRVSTAAVSSPSPAALPSVAVTPATTARTVTNVMSAAAIMTSVDHMIAIPVALNRVLLLVRTSQFAACAAPGNTRTIIMLLLDLTGFNWTAIPCILWTLWQ